MRPSVRRRLQRALLSLTVLVLLLGYGANRWIINSTKAYLYQDAALLPVTEVGLVLGTSHFSRSGGRNLEFEGRMRAAAELYKAGKVKHLIVSGANPDATYNEPRQMRRALIALGVPGEAITMDFAGFRTFDSIIRAQSVWGLTRYTIISQRYHLPRAVFLARKLGMRDAIGYAARVGETQDLGARDPPRETFARLRAILDLYILGTQPKFFGEPQPLHLRPSPTPAAEDEPGEPF
jgi:SanA protein